MTMTSWRDYGRIRTAIERFIANRRDWDKHSLSSLLVSGSAGMGKSELIKQVIDEIGKLTRAYDKQFSVNYFDRQRNRVKEQLDEKLKLIESRCGADQVQVIVLMSLRKPSAELDFPFIAPACFRVGNPGSLPALTIWMFAQSSFPTSTIIESHAESLPNKSLRDFLTRIQLGRIDLPALKTSPNRKSLQFWVTR